VTSLRWPPGQRCGQRDAVRLDDQVVLRANTGAVDRRAASQRTTAKSTDVAAVYHSGRPVEPPEGVEPPGQLAIQPISDAGCLRVAQPPPSGDSRAASSRGSTRHGTPVTSTNRMAVNATRSSTRGRRIRRHTRVGNTRFQHRPEPIIDMPRLGHVTPPASVPTSSANPGTGLRSPRIFETASKPGSPFPRRLAAVDHRRRRRGVHG